MVEFTVVGEPKGKGRPNFSTYGGHITARTPAKTVEYENLVKMSYLNKCGRYKFPDDAQLAVSIKAYYSIPKSASKKRKEAMLLKVIRPAKKPDCDNVIKSILDSLNSLAYRDDAQVVDVFFHKFYDEYPRVEVIINEV